MSAAAQQVKPADLAATVRAEVERTIRRGIKGVEYLSSSLPPPEGMPREVLFQRGTLKLYRYRPLTDEVYRVPLLLVMSLINKPYIFDLAPGMSLIEHLLKSGYEVYLIDWGVPRREDKRLRIDDYALDMIPDCARRVMDDAGEDELTIVGYCMGGILSSIYAATHPNDGLKNLVCFTTPVNGEGMEMFRKWADPRHFDVDRLVDTLGNVPPDAMFRAMDMLRPTSRVFAQIQLWDNMWNDQYVQSYRIFDRWATDQIPFPGETFRQFMRDIMWKNSLVKGEMVLSGRKIDLSNIKASFMHVVAEHDHIAPYEATRVLVPLVGSVDKEEVVLKGGHVSVVAGPNAVRRLWPKLDAWLGERSV